MDYQVKQFKQTSFVMNRMRQDGFLTDVTLVCGQKEFPAHKSFLCGASPYFYGMFRSGMREANSERVELSNIGEEAMGDVLDFVYSGVVPTAADTDTEKMGNLIEAADFLGMDNLFECCLEMCMMSTRMDCFICYWQIADMYNIPVLEKHVVKFLADNFGQLFECDEFLNVTCSQLQAVLEHPDLKLGPVERTVVGILNWIRYDTEEREGKIDELLSSVDLTRASASFLENQLLKEPCVSNHSQLHSDVAMTAGHKRLLPQPKKQVLFFFSRSFMSYNIESTSFLPPCRLPMPLFVPTLATTFYDENLYFMGDFLKKKACVQKEIKYIYKYLIDRNKMILIANLAMVGAAAIVALNGLFYVAVSSKYRLNGSGTLFSRINPTSGENNPLVPTYRFYEAPLLFVQHGRVYVIGVPNKELPQMSVEVYSPLIEQWIILRDFFGGFSFSVYPGSMLCDGCVFVGATVDDTESTISLLNLVTCKHKSLSFEFEFRPEEMHGVWHVGGTQQNDEDTLMVVFKDCSFRIYTMATGEWGPPVFVDTIGKREVCDTDDEDIEDIPYFATQLIHFN